MDSLEALLRQLAESEYVGGLDLDSQKAFDSIDWELAAEALADGEVPEHWVSGCLAAWRSQRRRW